MIAVLASLLRRLALAAGLVVPVVLLACSAGSGGSTGSGSGGYETAGAGSGVESASMSDYAAMIEGAVLEDGEYVKPRLWLHGILGRPDLAKKAGAGGVRSIVDMNLLTEANARRTLQRYTRLDMGLCLSLRWKASGNDRVDRLPADSVVKEKTDILLGVLSTPEAEGLEGRLWIQFFNEVTGGPGTIQPEDWDPLFDWATETTRRIRREAPHVKIAGPAVTGLDVLQRRPSGLEGMAAMRHKGLTQAIEWSIRHADAVDVHLHAAGAEWAQDEIRKVREAMDEVPGGARTGLVVFEWSCARFKDRGDSAAVRDAIIGIYRAMCDARVLVAAYGAYFPPRKLGEVYQWKNLVDEQGNRNEPFYSTYEAIANGEIRCDR